MGKHRKLNPGDVVCSLKLLKNLGCRKYGGENTTFWKCQCLKCENIIDIPLKTLGKSQKDCGCGRRKPRKPIPIGQKYGRLTVLSVTSKKEKRQIFYLCHCDCGNNVEVRRDRLISGDTQSCGCIHNEKFADNSKIAHAINFQNNTSIPKMERYGKLQRNNTSGVSGVRWHKHTKKWCAQIQYKKKKIYLGYYDDIEEAKEIVSEARKAIEDDFWSWYKGKFPENEG